MRVGPAFIGPTRTAVWQGIVVTRRSAEAACPEDRDARKLDPICLLAPLPDDRITANLYGG